MNKEEGPMKEFDLEQITKLFQDREVKNTVDLQELLRDLPMWTLKLN